MHREKAIAFRKQAASILLAVLDQEVSPRMGLNCWPFEGNADDSVKTAYAMLWYLEADEDRHQAEVFYSDLQLQQLKDVAAVLLTGNTLTPQLMRPYLKYQPSSAYHWRYKLYQEPLEALLQGVKIMAGMIYQPIVLACSHKKRPPS
jgi:hypothetical protein